MFSPDKVPRTSGKPILTPLPPSVLSSSLLGGLLSGRSSSSSRRNQVITRNSPLKQGTKNYLAESIVPLLIEGLTNYLFQDQKNQTIAPDQLSGWQNIYYDVLIKVKIIY